MCQKSTMCASVPSAAGFARGLVTAIAVLMLCSVNIVSAEPNNTISSYFRNFFKSVAPKTDNYPLVRLRNDGRVFELYTRPSTSALIAARLNPPTRVVQLLRRCTPDWCFVRLGTAVGWLRKNRLLLGGEPEPSRRLEIARNTPEPARPDVAAAEQNDFISREVDIALPARRGYIPPRQEFATRREVAPRQKVASLRDVAPLAPPQEPASLREAAPRKELATLNTSATSDAASSTKVENPYLGDQSQSVQIDKKTYAIKGVFGKIFLSVYKRSTDKSDIVGKIPFFATDVQGLGPCDDNWCLVERGTVKGWVPQRHLSEEPQLGEPRLQLEDVMPVDTLNIYSAPDRGALILAGIAPPVRDIVPLKSCDEDWCQIRYLDTVGWVETTYLTRQ